MTSKRIKSKVITIESINDGLNSRKYLFKSDELSSFSFKCKSAYIDLIGLV